MKKYVSIILCLVAILTLLVACGTKNKKITFNATVLEVNETSILVEPIEGSNELKSSDKIVVSTTGLDTAGITAGSKVKITYNGYILESYPAQLGEVYDIEIAN